MRIDMIISLQSLTSLNDIQKFASVFYGPIVKPLILRLFGGLSPLYITPYAYLHPSSIAQMAFPKNALCSPGNPPYPILTLLCTPCFLAFMRARKNMLAGMLLLFCNSNFPAKSHFKASKRLTKRQSSS